MPARAVQVSIDVERRRRIDADLEPREEMRAARRAQGVACGCD